MHTSLQNIVLLQVYVLTIPHKRPQSFVHGFNSVFVAVLLIIAAISITMIYLLLLIAGGEMTKMKLRAALIQQMEAGQQAERKNVNKSLALARASHDVRASLAGMTGLIEICHELVDPRSELEANLVQMEACTKDLLGKVKGVHLWFTSLIKHSLIYIHIVKEIAKHALPLCVYNLQVF